MRYIKQQAETTCGPIALLNILKWAGCRVSLKRDKARMQRLTLWAVEHRGNGFQGCTPYGIYNALHDLDEIEITEIIHGYKSHVLRKLDSHLKKGEIALIRYYWKDGKKVSGHYALCIAGTNKTYTMVNDSQKRTVICRSRETLRKLLHNIDYRVGEIHLPVIWFIEKKPS